MKAWAARNNEDGTLELYAKRPILTEGEEDGESFSYFTAADGDVEFLEIHMGIDFHKEVTIENSPMRIELTKEDMIEIMTARRQKLEEEYTIGRLTGYMNIQGVAVSLGKAYVLNHLIGLLEANIDDHD